MGLSFVHKIESIPVNIHWTEIRTLYCDLHNVMHIEVHVNYDENAGVNMKVNQNFCHILLG